MPSRLIELFGSYDLFGKSVPGAVFALGLTLILPKSIIPLPEKTSVLGIIALAVVLLFIGLMIGQGVHTLADNMEKAFLWFATRIRNIASIIQVLVGRNISIETLELDEDDESRVLNRFLSNGWNKSLEWVRRRYWGTYDSIVGHRYLLGKSIQWNFDPEYPDKRWELESRDELYQIFVDAYQDTYGEDIRTKTPIEIRTQYPLITSQLSKQGVTQYRTFQSIYSFCRSMWVVFFLLIILFSSLILGSIDFMIFEWIPSFGGIHIAVSPLPYEPIGSLILPSALKPYVIWALVLGAITFFDAAGTYKRHFVEYLIADFAVNCSQNAKCGEEENMKTNPTSTPRIQPKNARKHPHDDW